MPPPPPVQFLSLPPATKLGQGYIFTGVCDSVHRGGIPACIAGGIPACLAAGLRGCLVQRRRPGPGGVCFQEGLSRPTPKGEVEGNQVQAHTQGGNCGGSGPGPHPRGKLRGIWSSPPPPPDGYCCGRYASYWNAFFFSCSFCQNLAK